MLQGLRDGFFIFENVVGRDMLEALNGGRRLFKWRATALPTQNIKKMVEETRS